MEQQEIGLDARGPTQDAGAKLVVDTRNATRRVMRHRDKIVLC